jgi:phosphatidylglycerol:prolipoprotein diacylglycerol transferase
MAGRVCRPIFYIEQGTARSTTASWHRRPADDQNHWREANATALLSAPVLLTRRTSPNIAPVFGYYVHDLDPFVFHITPTIGPRWYGLAYVAAFFCAYLIYRWESKRGYADLPLARVADFITGVALFGVIVGGRIGYAIFYKPDMLTHPLSILRVWEGGMASHGGMIGVLAFTFYFARRHGYSWLNLGDNLVVSAPLGLLFGRCANFINGELYGRVANVAWAVQFPKELFDHPEEADRAVAACSKIDPSLTSPDAIVAAVHRQPQVKEVLRSILTPRHPSQLYEAFFEGTILFAILWFIRTRLRQPNGFLTGAFFLCYAAFRIVIENLREPDADLVAGFTRGQFLSFFLIAVGLAFIIYAKLRPTYPARMPKHA